MAEFELAAAAKLIASSSEINDRSTAEREYLVHFFDIENAKNIFIYK